VPFPDFRGAKSGGTGLGDKVLAPKAGTFKVAQDGYRGRARWEAFRRRIAG